MRKPARRSRAGTHQASKSQSEPKKIRCGACEAIISDESQLFSMSSGAPLYMNRYGCLHELLTVCAAQSLTLVGAPTLLDTWFAGYAWQIAICTPCGEHIGWRYTAVSADAPRSSFYGLRRAAVKLL